MTLTGTVVQINATLAAANDVVYAGAANFNGSDALTVVTSDAGNTGTGGPLTRQRTRWRSPSRRRTTRRSNTVPARRAFAEDTTTFRSPGLSISDVDAGQRHHHDDAALVL